ncbi:MAG: hypothetical protein IJR70_01530 [Eubacterium sp.]|nr:hypothetical protein [Eubacterium sp.]
MKKFKVLLSVILTVILIITVFPVGTLASAKNPSKPTSLTASSTVNSVTLKWKKVNSANGYKVYSYNSKTKKYSYLKTAQKNTCKISKLSSASVYIFSVKAYKKSGNKTYYSAYSAKTRVATLPGKVSGIKILGRNVSSVKLSWNKVKKASGYKVEYSTDKNFKKNVKSTKTTSVKATVKSLSNITYYIRIYAYKKLAKKTYLSAPSSAIKTAAINSSTLSTVNTSKKYQTIEGFGASAAWWGHKVGGWDNAENIIKYLYDKKDGIGLNIYRYNVGTGSRNDTEIYNYWSRTDGFIKDVDFVKQNITYDFTRDAEAQNSLKIAKKFAGKDLKVSLFSNSPPVQLTKNGKAYCSFNEEDWYWGWKSNLDPKNYKLYAKFECDVADYFVKQGYNVIDISPVNEPQFAWAEWKNGDGTFSMGQEGAHYKPDELKNLFKEMVLKADGKSYNVSMFEAGAAEGLTPEGDNTHFTNYVNEIYSLFINKNKLRTISTHSYWANADGKKACRDYVDSIDSTINIACTEYCQMLNDESNGVVKTLESLEGEAKNGYTIDFGVQLARVINEDLTILNATQWNWWTACSNGIYPDGLVYINDSNHSDIKLTKRLWCLGNYSKFIKSGAVRVDVKEKQKDLLSSAFLNPDGSLVIVYVNQTTKNINVNIDANNYSKYKLYRTTALDNIKLNSSGDFYSQNELMIPMQSVVSVILTK